MRITNNIAVIENFSVTTNINTIHNLKYFL